MTQLNISGRDNWRRTFLSYFHCHWIGERALKAAKVLKPT